MENNRTDKKFSQQPNKKADMPSKTSTSTRPEIDLPLKGGRADSDLASKGSPKRDDIGSDKKQVR
ncbi:MAG: hypothetical protein H7336_03965 [Bacteriovorax sp.]|nr:hypothetical protein [Bacteriovorax sp.]